ncbi:hypothetical protein EIN_165010 [Entamoeba invadens IP1]|uniref:DH domain-containing protein n=1 Tax=Entamoeba invadens IP1 TaxID=370355 RepID=A0A0A1U7N4_ENTIV|nr:hypothetical protein EIN_165010 [Entamoeba invadens IP1]ELP89061.1 hypothetical protein EIN_165010 [Entamoeba invadens IP1]|eukprot:XP_004255832.1 hypothetical protein EIN_165010 [Entamoeba invadens IP1]
MNSLCLFLFILNAIGNPNDKLDTMAKKTIEEILMTEETYLSGLFDFSDLISNYRGTFEYKYTKMVETIFKKQNLLVDQLIQAKSKSTVGGALEFLHFFTELFYDKDLISAYVDFVSKIRYWNSYLAKMNPHNTDVTLRSISSLIVSPMQRVIRYKLFIENISKLPQFKGNRVVHRALKRISSVADSINNA